MSSHKDVASQGLLRAGISLLEVSGWDWLSAAEGAMAACQWEAF